MKKVFLAPTFQRAVADFNYSAQCLYFSVYGEGRESLLKEFSECMNNLSGVVDKIVKYAEETAKENKTEKTE